MSPLLRIGRTAPSVVTVGVLAVVVLGPLSRSAGATSPTAKAAAAGGSVAATAVSARPPGQTMVAVAGSGAGREAVPAGFPSALTTGVPSGTVLQVFDGSLQITASGTVVQNMFIRGCVTVRASRVTIRDTRIVCAQKRPAVSILGSQNGAVISHVEIDGAGVATVGLDEVNAVATAVNIHGTNDGVHLGRNAVLKDSYVHDLATDPAFHHDDLQTMQNSRASGIQVIHNTLQAFTATKSDNSVYHLGSGAISNVLVEDNFIDGGHYSVEVSNGPDQHHLVFTGNSFGRHFRYGILMLGNPHGRAVSFMRNVWQATGRPATPEDSKGYGADR